MQNGTAHCIAFHRIASQCSAVQCSAVQCSAVQCSAVQCSAVQYFFKLIYSNFSKPIYLRIFSREANFSFVFGLSTRTMHLELIG
jgi:hypothetical protein